MKLSFSTASFYHLPLRFPLSLALDLGFDGVEMVVGLEYILRGQRAISELCSTMGVKPLSLHPPLLRTPGWPLSHTENIRRAVAAARALGCELVVIHASDAWVEGNRRWREYASAMRAALETAGQPITVGVEISQFTRRTRREAMDDVDAVLHFVEEMGEQVGITLDTAHTGANGDDLLALYTRVRPRLRNIHLSDWVPVRDRHRTHLMPGKGILPLEEFFAALVSDAYPGLVTLEISPQALHAWSLRQGRERLAESLAIVRGYIQAAETRAPGKPLEESAHS